VSYWDIFAAKSLSDWLCLLVSAVMAESVAIAFKKKIF